MTSIIKLTNFQSCILHSPKNVNLLFAQRCEKHFPILPKSLLHQSVSISFFEEKKEIKMYFKINELYLELVPKHKSLQQVCL